MMTDTNDPYDLDRFVRAQTDDYARALAEIRSGRKRSHWMWFGTPDEMKLRSCATLFACASPAGSVFHRLLET
jgi:uncharacterized protein (DUF1810 family)